MRREIAQLQALAVCSGNIASALSKTKRAEHGIAWWWQVSIII
jgi:hypothetical protein